MSGMEFELVQDDGEEYQSFAALGPTRVKSSNPKRIAMIGWASELPCSTFVQAVHSQREYLIGCRST